MRACSKYVLTDRFNALGYDEIAHSRIVASCVPKGSVSDASEARGQRYLVESTTAHKCPCADGGKSLRKLNALKRVAFLENALINSTDSRGDLYRRKRSASRKAALTYLGQSLGKLYLLEILTVCKCLVADIGNVLTKNDLNDIVLVSERARCYRHIDIYRAVRAGS